jgi:predicted transcriptional regulator
MKKNREKVIRVFLTKEEADRAFGELVRKAFAKELKNPVIDETFISIEELVRIFTPRRMELLAKIQELKPNSITELAQKLERDFKNVYNDLKALATVGLVDFKGEGRNKKPYLPYERVKLMFAKSDIDIKELSALGTLKSA